MLGSLVVGPLALWGFVRVERRAAHPLLPLRYLARPGFSAAILSQTLLNGAYMGSFILTPLLLQNVLDFTETKTGLVSIARPLAFSLAGPLAGAYVLRVGARRAASSGSVAVVVALVWMATLGGGSSVPVIMGALALAGVGMGLAMPPLSASVTVSVDQSDLGIAGAAQHMMIQVGVVFGITLMQAVQQARLPTVGLEASYHWGYGAGALLALAAVLTSLRIAELRGREVDLDTPVEPLPTT